MLSSLTMATVEEIVEGVLLLERNHIIVQVIVVDTNSLLGVVHQVEHAARVHECAVVRVDGCGHAQASVETVMRVG